MRRISLGLASVLMIAWSAGAQGATLTGKLVDLNAANQAVGSVHSIGIYLKTDVPYGISSAEMEIISAGTGKANYGTQSSATAANSAIFASTFGAQGYGTVKPSLGVDSAGDTSLWYPKPVVGAATDGDFDAVGLAFFATPGSVDSDPGDGAAFGMTNGFELVATEKWVFNATETLNLYISSAEYFSDTSGGAITANQDFLPANIFVIPESASLALLGLGGLGLMAGAQRRRRTVA